MRNFSWSSRPEFSLNVTVLNLSFANQHGDNKYE